MLKKQYLNSEDVRNFLGWLSDRLDHDKKSDIKLHSWESNSVKAASCIGYKWSCQSLYDAYKNYYWDGAEYPDTADTLDSLAKNLHSAIDNGDADQCKNACIEILKWGGVDKPKIAKQIRELSGSENKYLLPAYLNAVKQYLSKNDIDSSVTSIQFEVNGKAQRYELDIDSGTTKIFSLLHDDFIIYDSRVGSALCMLVSMWLDDRKDIPEELKFSWQDGGGGSTDRNPNRGALAFPRIKKGKSRNEHNFHASWLLKRLLEVRGSEFNRLERPLRALEAALFMIGYDLKNYKPEATKNSKNKVRNKNQKITSARESAENKPTNTEKLWAQIQTKWKNGGRAVTIKELIKFAPYNPSEFKSQSSYDYAMLTLLSDRHNFILHENLETKAVIDDEVKKTNRNNGIWRKHLNSQVKPAF